MAARTKKSTATPVSEAERERKKLEWFMAERNKAKDFHDQLAEQWAKSDEAFEAILAYAARPKNQPTIDWQSTLAPPFVGQIVEIIVANLIDDDLEADLIPSDPAYEQGAKAHECLLADQMDKDRFREKIVAYWLQLAVRGVSALKVPWYQEWEEAWWEYEAEDGSKEYKKKWQIVKDQPGVLPIDIMQLYWDPAASNMDDCRYVFYESYDTIDNLEVLAKEGPNGEEPIYKNIDKLRNDSEPDRPQKKSADPPKDYRNRVLVCERWSRDRLIVVANGKYIIRDEPNPFIHSLIPFVIAHYSPKQFRVEGRSVPDFVGDIQKMVWEFMNQTVDNARLMNNAVVLMRDSLEDEKRYQAYPGARWPVMNPTDVKFWEPNSSIITNGGEIIDRLKSELGDLSGSVAYLSGASSDQINNETATTTSILSNGAQKRILFLKNMGLHGIERAVNLMIKCNQQLISKPVQLRIAQKYGGYQWIKVSPQQLHGNYDYRIRSTTESLNRQEKRAEIATLLQQTMSNAPILAQLDPTIEIDYLELWSLYYERFGLQADKFIRRKQMDPMQAMMGGMQQQPMMPQQQQQATPLPSNVIPFPQQEQAASGY